jgi:hypothetical protein
MYKPVPILQGLAIVFCVLLIGFVIEAIRRYRLNERYAILWLAAASVLLLLSVFRPLLDWIAIALNISYGPTLLFLVAFLFLLGIVLHYSLVISSHRDSIRRLTQQHALLAHEVEQLHQHIATGSQRPPQST